MNILRSLGLRLGAAIITPLKFSRHHAHWRSSLLLRAVDRAGKAVPWYTFPAIDFLARRDYAGKRVLEFGSGQSTLWWAERAKDVVSIEEDEVWAARTKRNAPKNVTVEWIPVPTELDRTSRHSIADLDSSWIDPVTDYVKQLGGKFDVIIIDGHMRPELTSLSFKLLSRNGAIIFDNSEGHFLWEILQLHECERVDFYGFAPGVHRPSCTSIIWIDRCFLFDRKAPITL